jgi:hypothetical protein
MNGNTSLKKQLDEIAIELESKYGIKVYFCEIIGNRWSFFAGDKTLDIPEHRIPLNDSFGIMTGEISCRQEEWEKILEDIKANLSV